MSIKNTATQVGQRKVAIIVGIAILAIALFAGFAYGFVIKNLVIPEDAAVTVTNIRNSQGLFRLGIFSWVIILLLDVLIAWGLHSYFKSVSNELSLLTAWLRLIYAAFLAVAIFSLMLVLVILDESQYSKAFDSTQTQGMVMLFLDGFNNIWSVGLVVFGFHLLALSYLIRKSIDSPKIIPNLLLFAAISYLIVHLSYLLFPPYKSQIAVAEMFLSLPMAIGELALGAWLIWGSVKKR